MNVLTLGSGGMLGHKITLKLQQEKYNIVCAIRDKKTNLAYKKIELFNRIDVIENLNLINIETVKSVLKETMPDVVINCAGIIKQKKLNVSPLEYITINSLLPHVIAETIKNWNGKLIHFSTDCVFDGVKGFYKEEDTPNATDLYGKTKSLGDVNQENCLTIRTSIIGREIKNFTSLLEWFLSQKEKQIYGYSNAIFSGITTNYLASLIPFFLERPLWLNGIYNIASAPIDKFNLLLLLNNIYRKDIEVQKKETPVINRTLIGEKFTKETGIAIPSWKQMIKDMFLEDYHIYR